MNRGVQDGKKRLALPDYLGVGDPANDGKLLQLDSTQPGGVKLLSNGTFVPVSQTQSADGAPAYVFRVQPATTANPEFQLVQSSAQFNAVWDDIAFLGWNAAFAVGQQKAGVPSWYMGFEYSFENAGHLTCEWYIDYASPDGLSGYRPIMVNAYRDDNTSQSCSLVFDMGSQVSSNRAFQIQAGAGNVLFSLNPAAGSALTISWPVIINQGKGLQLDASSGGSAKLLYSDQGASKWALQILDGSGAWRAQDVVNNRNQFVLSPGAAGSAVSTFLDQLVVNAASGQSAAIQVWQSNGSVVRSILPSGQMKTAATNESTGAGSAALGANCPAVTATAPYTWEKVTTSDGSQGYVPIWK